MSYQIGFSNPFLSHPFHFMIHFLCLYPLYCHFLPLTILWEGNAPKHPKTPIFIQFLSSFFFPLFSSSFNHHYFCFLSPHHLRWTPLLHQIITTLPPKPPLSFMPPSHSPTSHRRHATVAQLSCHHRTTTTTTTVFPFFFHFSPSFHLLVGNGIFIHFNIYNRLERNFRYPFC